jgi:AraC family transcriptional regulator
MLSHRLPDPLEAGHVSGPGIETTFIHAFSREEYYYPKHATPYLLVCNFGQAGNYLLNGQQVRADEQLFYFLNAGDELEIRYEGRLARETLLILFDAGMVEQAVDAMVHTPQDLLDRPMESRGERTLIPPLPFAYTTGFRQMLDRIRSWDRRGNHMAEAFADEVLAEFFRLHKGANTEMRKLSAAKSVTRQELYRRLVIARAFMEERFSEPLTIAEIAREACLNRYYFIELFRTAFGVTPHQYLRRKKLENAHRLLQTGEYSVTAVCHLAGFQSVASFTNLFRRTFGQTPSEAAMHPS